MCVFFLPGNRHKGWDKTVLKTSWLSSQSKTLAKGHNEFHSTKNKENRVPDVSL